MTKDRSRGITHSKWFLPSFSFVLGLVILAVAWLGGQPGEGVFGLAGLTAFGLFFLLAGRSETVRGLRGDGRDERFARIDLQATAVAGLALLVALIVAWLWPSPGARAAVRTTGSSPSAGWPTCSPWPGSAGAAERGPALRTCAAWRCSARCCRSSDRPGWCRAG
jgi:hypothetical protein